MYLDQRKVVRGKLVVARRALRIKTVSVPSGSGAVTIERVSRQVGISSIALSLPVRSHRRV
jgi:hypothetical protein